MVGAPIHGCLRMTKLEELLNTIIGTVIAMAKGGEAQLHQRLGFSVAEKYIQQFHGRISDRGRRS